VIHASLAQSALHESFRLSSRAVMMDRQIRTGFDLPTELPGPNFRKIVGTAESQGNIPPNLFEARTPEKLHGVGDRPCAVAGAPSILAVPALEDPAARQAQFGVRCKPL
jgi:hypothetical protein